MENTELLRYIKDAIDLETDVAVQTRIIDEAHLAMSKNRPELISRKIPNKPVRRTAGAPTESSNLWPIGLLFLLLAALCSNFDSTAAVTIPAIIGIVLILPKVFSLITQFEQATEARIDYERDLREYEQSVEEAKKQNLVLQDEYFAKLRQWNQSNDEMTAYVSTPLTRTQNLLARHYAQDIIYPKYRNLPALTTIYEYLLTGRCDSLTGPAGAYNLYESEVRADMIISQLNTVIENLEQTRQNQYMLYQQVRAIQENTDMVATELRRLEGHTIQIAQLSALNAYYNALNARHEHIVTLYEV